MLANAQMTANRFANFARYRKFVSKVQTAVNAGHKVNIQSGWTVMPFTKKNLECLKATKGGVFVQRGKSWVCIMDRAVTPSKVWAN